MKKIGYYVQPEPAKGLSDLAASGGITLCGCVGPQNGEPVCPCLMRHVKIVDGRYVQIIDYGPAPAK